MRKQIALEGEISREAVNNALKRGLRENIDTISWTVDTQVINLIKYSWYSFNIHDLFTNLSV